MTECAHHASLPCEQSVLPCESERSARSLEPLPKMLLSPGSVRRRTAVPPSRPPLTMLTRVLDFAWTPKPHSPGEFWKVQKNWRAPMFGVGVEPGVCVGVGAGAAAPVRIILIEFRLKYCRSATTFMTWRPACRVTPRLPTQRKLSQPPVLGTATVPVTFVPPICTWKRPVEDALAALSMMS